MLSETSPFDQAMARPILDEPAKRKWIVSQPSSSYFCSKSSLLSDDEEDDDYESVSFETPRGDNSEGPPISSQSSQPLFDELDDELIGIAPPPALVQRTSSARLPPKGIAGPETSIKTQSFDIEMGTDCEKAIRLSWNSIKSFDIENSEMENLVQIVKKKHDRTSRFYSFLGSVLIVMVVCYIVAGFFEESSSSNTTKLSTDDSNGFHGSPQFLINLTP